MNAIVAALLADPAILSLHSWRLASDIQQRFGVSSRIAYAAIIEAIRFATDAGCAPMEFAA